MSRAAVGCVPKGAGASGHSEEEGRGTWAERREREAGAGCRGP